jgi:hypothetical protein
MKSVMLPVILLLGLANCAPQKPLGPWTDNFNTTRSPAIAEEARSFIIQRQGCDHFRGEPPYDEEREQFLLAQIKKLCTGSDAKLKYLRTQYADQSETIKALAEFDECIEYETSCAVGRVE